MVSVGVLLLVCAVYWPVLHAGFAWDDFTAFVENDWLVAGDQWRHYVLRDFHGWINYFRPLGVLLFTAQARLFDSQSGPMHMVSLVLHVAGTALIGVIVAHCTRASQTDRLVRVGWIGACMLMYGLHPALTESIAWISSQFELLLVLFVLTGAWAAITMPTGWTRALAMGLAFFLAACSKETAVVMPLLVLLFDWAVIRRRDGHEAMPAARRAFVLRNAGAAAAMLIAGLAYLVFRNFGLGHLLVPTPMYGGELSPLGNVQKIAWTGWSYLKLLLVPAQGLDAVHSFEATQFQTVQPGLLVFAIASVALTGWAAYATIARGTPYACLILAVFLTLFPTLNILPAGYAISLYHDRYVALALAMCCVMLPLTHLPRLEILRSRAILAGGCFVAIAWVAASLATIRATLPTWRDDESLWRSTIVRNAANEVVQYNLVAALLRNALTEDAAVYTERFAESGTACARCDIEVASVLLDEGRIDRASWFLHRAGTSPRLAADLDMRGRYQLIAGQLAFLQERHADAIPLLRDSIAIHAEEVLAHYLLAESLALTGDLASAEVAADAALAFATESQRTALRQWRTNLIWRGQDSPAG